MEPVIDRPNSDRRTEPQGEPDIMNDPAYDTMAKEKKGNPEEPDTCRICRGEGSQDEPLFYPCKCSGSIKFVHQNCLMEWLSHSQKKHCELCKTTFHFTKLYSPHMPNTVPLPIFLRQAVVHTWKSILTSSRFLLVTFVWTAWLPWCMRTIWRGLFWIADGAWINWTDRRLLDGSAAYNITSRSIMSGYSPLNQTLNGTREATASAIIAHFSSRLPRLILTSQPWSLLVAKKLYSYFSVESPGSQPSPEVAAANITSNINSHLRTSWLSNFRVMQTLTPSTVLNNMLIDTLEGQLITIFMVTAFILVFLIREWVVQQQPMINANMNLNLQVAVAQDAPAPQQAADQGQHEPDRGDVIDAVDEGGHAQGRGARMIARARARPRRPIELRRPSEQNINSTNATTASTAGGEENRAEGTTHPQPSTDGSQGAELADPDPGPNQPRRPGLLNRGSLAQATEIRRIIEEHSRTSDAQEDDTDIFKDIWDRAGTEPSELIDFIDQSGRRSELGFVVAALKKEEFDHGASSVHEARHSQMGRSSNSTDDNRAENSDDFILLNKPSTTASPERLPHLSGSPASNTHSDVESSVRSGNLNPGDHKGLNAEINPASSNQSPDTFVAEPRREPSIEAAFTPRVALNDPSSDNPFHPDYNGTLPEATVHPHGPIGYEEADTAPGRVQGDDSTQMEHEQAHDVPNHAMPGRAKHVMERISDWLWGGVAPLPAPAEQPAGDDEHVVQNIAEEAPFVPVDHGQPLPLAANDGAAANQNPEVVAAAIQAGINPNEAEAAEEIEDLEGIMELIGMQGPLAGLVQNGMFCACLVSLTILFGVWIPYISGKLFLVLLAHPFSLLFRIPLSWAASSADSIIDLFTFCAGCTIYWTAILTSMLYDPLLVMMPSLGILGRNTSIAETARSYAESALERLTNDFLATGGMLSETDIPVFSVVAHESLQSIETSLAWVVRGSYDKIVSISSVVHHSSGVTDLVKLVMAGFSDSAKTVAVMASERTSSIVSFWPSIMRMNPLRINLALPQRTIPLDYDLANWDAKDRGLAIAFGYLFFALMGVAYLHISPRIHGSNRQGRAAGGLADGLYQAGGVMKVIFIISIEMIVFPLYCGLLLDVALMPLFKDVTFMSRFNFTMTSPNTSLFVHWFVGTCYMFHFALFVSMCRKILRSGVLYFIRDPDDPTFHPVRDVLERSVSTQLWKISFSALVYGGLVIVCLGGVVWGMAYTFPSVFPIHWSSNEPVLEFPVDLLFYNFLMPLAVKFFKPSKGLNKIYGWWFRRCARALRLTHFLFGEEKEDEEDVNARYKTTTSAEDAGKDFNGPVIGKGSTPNTIAEVHFRQEGRYVRAPGSDQVRIPRGSHTFLEVDKDNNRVDGQPDNDQGSHGRKNEMFTKVYIPPRFRLRISAFVFLIWVFAAVTGISMTVLPLVFGRFVFSNVAPKHLQMNDIYAFSIGIYTLGGALYAFIQRQPIINYIQSTITPHTTTITSLLRKTASVAIRILSLLYVCAAFGIFLPGLLSVLMEFYLIIPVHTYFSTTFASLHLIQSERHIIHLVQDWTLGVLYLKMAARLILWNTPSRPATALRAIVRNGWFNPDVRLATRGFIVPATLAMGIALAAPLSLGWLANMTVFHVISAKDEVFRACVYRYSYPGILGFGFAVASLWLLAKAFFGWRKKVRDEVYLIGERLHNFGEGKKRKGKRKGNGKGKEREEREEEKRAAGPEVEALGAAGPP